ncbi:MAG: substrate-binding domain-containing protein [Planctomycetota bacterium]|nr:substrate-binding domain-containing protein [Planctomycetota bacterium]
MSNLRTILAAGAAVLLFTLAACGGGKTPDKPAGGGGKASGGETNPEPAPPGKKLKIAMIAKASNNPVFLSAKTGAEAAAKEIGSNEGIAIEIAWLTPMAEDGQAQAQFISQAVNEGANAILISCSDAAKVTGAIDDAVAGGVPVMTFDSDAAQSKRFAYYGVDDLETGRMVMAELAILMEGKGNVAILAGNQNAPNLQNRVKGVKEEAAKYPDIKIVDVFYHPEPPQDAVAKVLAVNKDFPEVNGWAFVGGWPLFTKALLTDLDPNKYKVVSVDALPECLPYVDKGVVPVLLAQPTYKWGYESVRIIVEKVVHKKDVSVMNRMELVRVNKDTLGAWAKQLKDWGFTVDPEYLALP